MKNTDVMLLMRTDKGTQIYIGNDKANIDIKVMMLWNSIGNKRLADQLGVDAGNLWNTLNKPLSDKWRNRIINAILEIIEGNDEQ